VQPSSLNIAAVQLDIAWEDKLANFAKVRRFLEAAQLEKNSLVVLPEMFATGFSMNTNAIAELYGGPTEQFLATIAKDFSICVIGGAAMRAPDGRVRNKALAFSPNGELIGFYAKMRPFTPGGEPNHYTAGERAMTFEFSGCKISPFICYDLRFPEIFRESTRAHRPELFIVIASWPEKRIMHWPHLLRARAIENQAYLVAVNRIGSDPFYSYNGQSVIVDPHGAALADAGTGECVIQARIDFATLQKYREGLPFLADMRA
jgi:omega-amidase